MSALKKTAVVFVLIVLLIPGQAAYGAEEDTENVTGFMEGLDLKSIDSVVSDNTYNNSFSFSSYVWEAVKGGTSLSFASIGQAVINSIKNEFGGAVSILTKLLTIALISAIFANFSNTFQNGQVAETSHFVTYILMTGLLTASYMAVAASAREVLKSLLEFMKVMVPVYSMSIVFCGGTGSSAYFYQAVMSLITLVDYALLNFVIPLINMYMMAMFANFLTEDDALTKLAELIATAVNWMLKTAMALVIGIGTIKSLISPAVDHVKSTAVLKWAQAIPGIGGLFQGVTETVLGAASLIKNAVGAAGVIAIIVILAVPLVKLLVYVFLYKAGCAIISPVADKRLTASVSSCVESTMMLIKTIFTAGVLFMIVIVLAATSTTMYL